MIGSYFGHFLDKPLSSLARKVRVSPDTITIAGFVITVIAAYVLTLDLVWGGLLLIFGALFDLFDGVVARAQNRSTEFGAFLDSVLDRYSDAFLFSGFAWHFLNNGSLAGVAVTIGAMIGALLISYARARAEGLGQECTTGIMERPERIVLMALAALTGLVMPIMVLMFVLTHVTVVQRMLHVKKSLKSK